MQTQEQQQKKGDGQEEEALKAEAKTSEQQSKSQQQQHHDMLSGECANRMRRMDKPFPFTMPLPPLTDYGSLMTIRHSRSVSHASHSGGARAPINRRKVEC